jgi:hypothetical protein
MPSTLTQLFFFFFISSTPNTPSQAYRHNLYISASIYIPHHGRQRSPTLSERSCHIQQPHSRPHPRATLPAQYGCQATNIDFQSATSLGALEILPIELQQLVVKELDVQSLLVFHRVNKRAMDLVASLIEWQKVCHHIALLNDATNERLLMTSVS